MKDTDPSTTLRDWIQDYFRHYALQPVQDTSLEWPQLAAPFHTVATIHIPKQDAFDPEFCQWWSDHIQLYAWAGLEEHRPLGSNNRIRKRHNI